MKKLGLALVALVALNVSAFAGVITIHDSNLVKVSGGDDAYAKIALDNAKEEMKDEFNTDNLEIYAIESIKKDDPHEYEGVQRALKVMKQEIAKGKTVYYNEFLVVDRKTNWASEWDIECDHFDRPIKLSNGVNCRSGISSKRYNFK
ncbi:TPA: hypothetical protein R4443_000751 [Campylobacter jejuni]|uniref:hypothetical protein n=1 Tax=Campylobacter TaxID=194 RepID=UPI000874903D|nr:MULTISPECIES: hypothetical protein [Campylobacter]OEV56390.1 hypothetical protein AJY67_02675 [Campylobacter jejuni]OEW46538.1 hypothetical protein AJ887_04150 [Campylobacter sp. BCW_6466]HDZ4253980.1 hypothetical protein [Campylobacter jejuni]HED4615233.1 hypothetical protein [Campylobacter jejuni]HEG0602053.1 hypothetical protein [Campylobacter jejuni]